MQKLGSAKNSTKFTRHLSNLISFHDYHPQVQDQTVSLTVLTHPQFTSFQGKRTDYFSKPINLKSYLYLCKSLSEQVLSEYHLFLQLNSEI